MKEVPVVFVNIPDVKRERELCLRLSKNTGSWDYDLLANFDEIELKDIGFEGKELDKIFKLPTDEAGDEFDTEKDLESWAGKDREVKEGDLWQLGNHRLLIGDAFKKENWDRLLAGEKVDMIFTDPPYGIGLDTDFSSMRGRMGGGHGWKYKNVTGDDKEFDPTFIFDFAPYCKEIFMWGADYYFNHLPKGGSLFCWDKRVDESMDKIYGSSFELCWSKKKHRREIIRIQWSGVFGLCQEDTKKRVHPTQKPARLAEWFIKKFSKRGDIILDCFGGSGSTLIACEGTDRRCRMMEIEPIYGKVILARWEKFTGQQAEKIGEGTVEGTQ